MSTERKPLLSDEEIQIARYETITAYKARDFYENLITTGKLRVVEEVELVPGGRMNTYHCSKCGWQDPPSHYPNCPGCGNKIKR